MTLVDGMPMDTVEVQLVRHSAPPLFAKTGVLVNATLAAGEVPATPRVQTELGAE